MRKVSEGDLVRCVVPPNDTVEGRCISVLSKQFVIETEDGNLYFVMFDNREWCVINELQSP